MFGFKTQLRDIPFDTAVAKVIQALTNVGFGVPNEIDLRATLEAKLNIEHRPYRILGPCIPPLALRTQEIDLPPQCSVVVREEADGSVTVGFIFPTSVLRRVDNPEVYSPGKEVLGTAG